MTKIKLTEAQLQRMILESVEEVLKENEMDEMFGGLKKATNFIGNKLKQKGQDVIDNSEKTLSNLSNKVSDAAGKAWNATKNAGNKVLNKTKDAYDNISNSANQFASGVKDAYNQGQIEDLLNKKAEIENKLANLGYVEPKAVKRNSRKKVETPNQMVSEARINRIIKESIRKQMH